MKICSICKQSKDVLEFNKNKCKPDGLQTVCRDCNRLRSKRYYYENHDKHIAVISARASKIRLERRQYLWDYLGSHPCVDCGNSDRIVLEFDHVRGKKINGVAKMVKECATVLAINEEIAKCEVRCKNCHAKATYARIGGSWHDKFLIE